MHVMTAIHSAGYSVVVPDLLGHGRSAKPTDYHAYSTRNMVDDIHTLLRFVCKPLAAGNAPIFVVGHSMGSALSVHAASELSDECNKTDMKVDEEAVELAGVVLMGTAVEVPKTPLLHCCTCFLECIRPILARLSSSMLWHSSVDPKLRDAEQRVANQNPFHVIQALGLGLEWPSHDTFSHVAQPTLVLQGDSDRLFPVDTALMASKLMPNAEFDVVEKCGHNIMVEHPEIVAELILTFFDKCNAQK